MKISIKQYAQALYELTLGKSEQEIDIVVEKFVKELAKHNNIKLASKIIKKFEEIYNKQNGIVIASVISAEKLDKNQIEKIERYLLDKYRAKQIVLDNEVKSEIKGGIILKVGEDMIDASVIKRIDSLKTFLME